MMKYLFSILILLATSVACSNESAEKAAASTEGKDVAAPTAGVVDVSTFEKLMEGDVHVLDVRTPEEFVEGNIPGAVNINIYDADFAERATAITKDKPLLVYCKMGGRSAKAASVLKSAGYTKVYDLEGGVTAWREAGKQLEQK